MDKKEELIMLMNEFYPDREIPTSKEDKLQLIKEIDPTLDIKLMKGYFVTGFEEYKNGNELIRNMLRGKKSRRDRKAKYGKVGFGLIDED